MKRTTIIETGDSYKVGMDEVVGLETAMRETFKPIETVLKNRIYWTDDIINKAEYKRRDGFIPHSHNCGGLEVRVVVPKCEGSDFGFLTFGECDECGNAETYPDGDHQCGYMGVECGQDSEGHLDAALRIWFKFEGIEDGKLQFYLYMGGGNGDAPYFRTQYSEDYFEASFECSSVVGLKRAAAKHIKALMEVLK